MIIKRLKLENYRRFAELDLEFPENIIGLVGRNGAGKSTIIEAIGWVLYGNNMARTDKQQVRSQFIMDNKACSAELLFTYGGHEYKIIRSLRGKNAVSEAAAYRDGATEPVAVQDRGVNLFVEELLSLDRPSFLTSVFARQKDLDALSSMRPEERRKSINRLINIDLIDRARERVRRDRNDRTNYIKGKRSLLKNEEELAALLSEQKAQAEKILREETELREQIERHSAELQKLKRELEDISKVRDLYNGYEAQIGKLESRRQETVTGLAREQQELENIKAAEQQQQQLRAELAKFDHVKAEYERLNEAATLHSRLVGHRKNLEILQESLQKEMERSSHFEHSCKELDNLQTEQEVLDSRITAQEEKIQSLLELVKEHHSAKSWCTEKGRELRERLAKIKELGPDGECPVCTQTLGDHYQHVSDSFNAQIEKLRTDWIRLDREEKVTKGELTENEKLLGQLRRQREDIVKKVAAAMEAQKNLARSQESVVNYREQIVRAQQDIDSLGDVGYDPEQHQLVKKDYESLLAIKEQSAQLQERISRKEPVEKLIAQLEQSIWQTEGEIKEAREKQGQLAYEEESYQQAQRSFEEQTRELDGTKDTLSKILQEKAAISNQVRQLEKEITEQKRIRKEIEEEEEAIQYLSLLDEYLGSFRLDLAGRIRPIIAQKASELLSLTTRGRYSLLHLDEDYNINLYDGNEAFQIERFSGGEQDLANLCLRIAISQVVAERSGGAPINMIVLDEIFGSQDLERRDMILYALNQLSNYFRQIFIITHIEQVRDSLPVIVDVRQTDEQRSEAVFV